MDTRRLHDSDGDLDERPDHDISRFDTGLRILLTALFAVIWGLVEMALGLIVLFGLGWTLVTRKVPPTGLRDVANRLVTYTYRIWRYVTQNEPKVPFPFSEFPVALEPPSNLGADQAAEFRELMGGVVEDVEDEIESAKRSRDQHAGE
jgi:hypothetical protein